MRESKPDDLAVAQRQLLLDLPLGNAKALDTYVPGSNVELIERLRGCHREAEFDCVWLYGPPGSGKTHLLQGACRAVTEHDAPVVYLPGALAAEDPHTALSALRGLDAQSLVALDDLECWLTLPGAEEALFGVYQGLLEQGRALLIASRLGPTHVRFCLDDLASRLRGAACFPLCELDDSDKAQVLINVAQERGLSVSSAVVGYLLRHGARDVPALLDSLGRLEQAAASVQRRVTVPLVKQVLDL